VGPRPRGHSTPSFNSVNWVPEYQAGEAAILGGTPGYIKKSGTSANGALRNGQDANDSRTSSCKTFVRWQIL